MEKIKTGGRSNGKSLENAITFMKYLDELENNKLYGIKKSGNITLLTKTECIPISLIEKRKEEIETMYDGLSKNPKEHLHSKTEYKIVIGVLQELLDERNNTEVRRKK